MHHLTSLIIVFGYTGFFAIIFLETSLPVFFFLPGDSLMLSAGILASQGNLSMTLLLIIGSLAAIMGGFLGYGLGKYLGVRIFSEEKKGLLNSKHRIKAEKFYAKHGSFAVIAARFVPVVRTFIPTLAGIGNMSLRVFTIANIIGGVLWAVTVPILGYYIGERFPRLVSYIPYAFGFVIVCSLLPVIFTMAKQWYLKRKTQ